jgi:tetratricopeptide (TPR) repeat protein
MSGRLLVLLLTLTPSVLGQLNSQSFSVPQRVRVNLAFTNGACDPAAHVALSGVGGIVAEGTVNSRCEVDLDNVPPGTYRITVTGQSFVRVDTDSVAIDASGMHDLEVKVRRNLPSNQLEESMGGGSLVSVTDLHIPPKARKEFDKANKAISEQDWPKAMERLNRAIALYPDYSSAYNNLGVVYGHLGKPDQELVSLQKAIGINDHCAPAYVNMARLSIRSESFPEAENLLKQASAYDPANATTLVLLSYVEFKDRHPDDVLATAHKAHTLPQSHAFVHWMAAQALEHDPNQIIERRAELKLFLQEEPTGPRADEARKKLAALSNLAY